MSLFKRFDRRAASCFALTGAVLASLAAAGCDEPQARGNQAPSAPFIEVPAGVTAGQPADFAVTVYDPDGDRVRVFVAWGDGDTSDYGSFVYSMQTVHFDHEFARPDTYYVSGRCHDLEPLFSGWSTPQAVVVTGGASSLR